MGLKEERWNLKGKIRPYLIAWKNYRNSFQAISEEFLRQCSEDEDHNEGDIFYKTLADNVANDILKDYNQSIAELYIQIDNIAKKVNIDYFTDYFYQVRGYTAGESFLSCFCMYAVISPINELINVHRNCVTAKNEMHFLYEGLKMLGLDLCAYLKLFSKVFNILDTIKNKLIDDACSLLYNYFKPQTSITNNNDLSKFEAFLPYADTAYGCKCGKKLHPFQLNGIKGNGKFHFFSDLSGYIAHRDRDARCGIIVAFKGTKSLKAIRNWATNILQHFVGFSISYIEALGLVSEVRKNMNHKDRCLYVTGHSLGGSLAQFSVATYVRHEKDSAKSIQGVGFNSAGLSDIAYDMLKGTKIDFTHVHLKKDVVFYLGHQLGAVIQQQGYESICNAHGIDSMRKHISDATIKNTYYII